MMLLPAEQVKKTAAFLSCGLTVTQDDRLPANLTFICTRGLSGYIIY